MADRSLNEMDTGELACKIVREHPNADTLRHWLDVFVAGQMARLTQQAVDEIWREKEVERGKFF